MSLALIQNLHKKFRLFENGVTDIMTPFEQLVANVLIADVLAAIKLKDGKADAATSLIRLNKLMNSIFKNNQKNYELNLISLYQLILETQQANIEYMAAMSGKPKKKVIEEFNTITNIRKNNWGITTSKGKLTVNPESQFLANYNKTLQNLKGLAAVLITREATESQITEAIFKGVNYNLRSSIDNHGTVEFRALNDKLGQKLGLKDWYYNSHTKIKTTRSHCLKYLGATLHITELNKWKRITWTGKYPTGSSYDPIKHNGGYQCRGLMLNVSKEFAKRRGRNVSEFE